MLIDKIMKDTSVFDLVEDINEFCKQAIMRDNDEICFELKQRASEATDNDMLRLLSSYLSAAEDGDEIVDALYEFVSNCKGFCEADKDTTIQITKQEVTEVLDDCEDKCGLQSCIDSEFRLNLIEADAAYKYREFTIRQKGDEINLILPRIDKGLDTKEYIAEELGKVLYDVLKRKLDAEYLKSEINRYIPESKNSNKSARELFGQYFYDVVLYKKRKPGIYTEFDDHMKRVLTLGFFERIIEHYLRE